MSTAAQPLISVSEYLHTSYQPDCDYVDGVIEERNLGELDHAEVQRALILWLSQKEREWKIRTVPEIRVQTSPTRFRIADICIVSVSAPREQIIQTAPVAIIEVMSPEDRVPRYSVRLEDYRRMGVRHIWVIDPATRKGYDCSAGNWIETASFAAQESPIRIDLATLFAAIDEDRAR
ncbi:MAG TPA: Uma2 family endonuclease [Silvibacterium sp.]|nr:Uma2 family endonuclease [Silvibacterium sp.]